MTDKSKARRGERFTMLPPSGPLNPSPEELATRVVELAKPKERFTMLEPSGPLNPSPEELATRVVEPLINDCRVPAESPPKVRTLIAELATAIEALDTDARAAALRDLDKLSKRLAG